MPPPQATSRPRRRRGDTRAELLDAARRVLSAKGFDRTRIADIVQAAHVSVGTFYLYYPTKEALLVELVDHMVRLLKAEFEDLRDRIADPVELVRVRNAAFFRFAHTHRDLFRIVFGYGGEFHGAIRRAQELFITDVAENIRDGIRAGVFRPGNPELLAHAFIGAALQVVGWWVERNAMPVAEVSELLLDFVLRGLGEPTPA